jgi:hypothetical protein
VARESAAEPFGRLMAPGDDARLARFPLSDESGVTTGSIVDQAQFVVGAWGERDRRVSPLRCPAPVLWRNRENILPVISLFRCASIFVHAIEQYWISAIGRGVARWPVSREQQGVFLCIAGDARRAGSLEVSRLGANKKAGAKCSGHFSYISRFVIHTSRFGHRLTCGILRLFVARHVIEPLST